MGFERSRISSKSMESKRWLKVLVRWIPSAAAILGSGLFLTGQQSDSSRVFTSAQAEAGRAAYENTCGQCHTPTLLGRRGDAGELPPVSSLSASYREFIGARGYVAPLAGKDFIDRWGSKTAAQLIARFEETVVSFPPEGMNDDTTVNITAYVLQVNGAKAGMRPLTRTTGVVVSSITR
jgi:mono/diheme cytochrome c family protein